MRGVLGGVLRGADALMSAISFTVFGVPRPQGSKRGFALPSGKVAMVEMSKELPSWRESVRQGFLEEVSAWKEGDGYQIIDGPVFLQVKFYFARPKSHYGRRGGKPYLKPDAPYMKTSTPDLSKLLRAVEDALEGVAYTNDSKIAMEILSKKYADDGRPCAWIKVSPL